MKRTTLSAAIMLVVAAVTSLTATSVAQNVSLDPSGRYYRNSSGQPIFLIGYYAWAAVVDGYTIDHVSSYSGMMNQGSPYRINYIRIGAQSPRMSASSNPPTWNGLTLPCPYAVDGSNRADLNNFNAVFWNGLAAQCALGQQKGFIVHISIFDGVGTRSGPAWGYGGSWWNPANQIATFYPNPDTNSNGGIDQVGEFYRTSEFNNGNPAGGTISYYEKRYIDKVIATVNSYDNVMYEVGNELGADSAWNTAIIAYIRTLTNKVITQGGNSTESGVIGSGSQGWSPHDPSTVSQYRSLVTGIVGHGYPAWEDTDNNDWSCTFGYCSCGGNCGGAYAAQDTAVRQAAWYSFAGGAAVLGGFSVDWWDWWNPNARGFSATLGNYMKNLQDFISNTGVPFWNMTPHHELVSNGSSTNSCLAAVGLDYVVYVLSDASVTVDLTTMSGSASWRTYDPVSATYSSFQTVAGGAVQTFNKPGGASDWVIQITNGGGEVLNWNTLGNTLDLGSGSVPAVAVDAGGNIHVVFVSGNSVQYRKYSSSMALLTSESISAPAGAWYPHIMCDSNSVPHITYTDGTIDYANICYYTNRIGGTWKSPIVAFQGSGFNLWYPRIGLYSNFAYIGFQTGSGESGLNGKVVRVTNLSTTPTVDASATTGCRTGISVNNSGHVFAIGRNGGAGTYLQEFDSNLNTVGGLVNVMSGYPGGSQTAWSDSGGVTHFAAWSVQAGGAFPCTDRCGMDYNNTSRQSGPGGSFQSPIQGLLGGAAGTGPDGNEPTGFWNDDVAPVITKDALGTVYVAWREWTSGGSGRITKVDTSGFTQSCSTDPNCGGNTCTGTQFSGGITRHRWWNCEIAPAVTRGVYVAWEDSSGHAFLRSVGVSVPTSPTQSLVSIDMGSTDTTNGLINPQVGDGNTTPVTIGGRDCRKNVTPATDRYFYFAVSDGFAFQGSKPNVYINVDYYDTGTSTLTLNYDGAGNAYTGGPSVVLTNTNTWKTVTWNVTDAYFGNRENNGADFRIFNSATTNFYIDKVSVYLKAYSGTPVNLPGTIEAEKFDNGGEGQAYHDTDAGNNGGQFRTGESVDIENTGDTGGGYNVGWINTGEYLNYQVNVTAAGKYNIGMRVASSSSTGQYHIEINGVNVTGTKTIISTGGGQVYTTQVTPGITLSAGVQTLKVVVETGTGNWNFNNIVVTSTAFLGAPVAVPGTVQAENYDNGGEGSAYHDTTTTNDGGQYRTSEGVDVETSADTGGGFDVGFINNGEWIQYQISVGSAGSYDFTVRAASPNAGVIYHLEINGVNVSGTQSIPNTGGWQNWADATVSNISLSAGVQTLRVSMDNGGWNFNYVTINPHQAPYGGTARAIPGTIQSEDFDTGGEGIAYHDTDTTNNGGQYRTTEGVDLETCTDTGGGYDIGWMGSGEWQEYTVNVNQTGDYVIQLRMSSATSGGSFHFDLDGVPLTSSKSMTTTGGWQTWTTINVPGIFLTAGNNRILRFTSESPDVGFNINYINFVYGGSDVVSEDLGSTNVDDGMTFPAVFDGNTTAVSIGGHNCRQNTNPNSDFYMYFNVADNYAFQGNKASADISFDYYDNGTGTLTLQYDGAGGAYVNGPSVTRTNTNTWKITTFHISDAYFGNRQNSGADFRIAGPTGGNTFYLDTLMVFATNVVAPPGQASAPSPATGATLVPITSTLSWTAGSGATSHDVRFGTANPPPFIQNQAGTTYNPGTTTPNTVYYWRIDEKNTGGTTTGVVWSYTTLPLPGAASAPNPANVATGVILAPTLSWTAGSNASSHDVRFGTANPPAFIQNQAGTSYAPGTLAESTVYFWRIDEKNSSGTTTGTVWSFTTGALPALATNPSPANAATLVPITSSLTWTAGSGATSHDVNFGTANPPPLIGNQTGTTYVPGTMAANTTYFWRIDEKNSIGTRTGTVWSFTTLPLPGAASAPSPANAATGVTITASLSWTAGSNAASHDVRFGTANPPPFIQNQAGTSYTPATMTPNTVYFWRIDEKNSSGTTTGTVWSFTTLPVPGVASAPNPANAATGVAITASLSWTAGSNASSHDVRFGTANPPPFIQNQAGTSYTPATMTPNTVYFWRIDEKNSSGTTTGTVWSFTTLPVPGVASAPNPANAATGVAITASLSWTAGSNASSHDVRFGTANPPPFIQNQAGTSYTPATMSPNTVYFWRIDEKNSSGTTTGTVWSFTTLALPGAASSPSPANGATGVSTSPTLTWTAGSNATSHDVRFGTANPPPFIQNQAGTSYAPGSLSGSTQYFWRIDEKNSSGTTTGTVWSFTTAVALPNYFTNSSFESGFGAAGGGYNGNKGNGWTPYTYTGVPADLTFADETGAGNTDSGAHSQKITSGAGKEGGVYNQFAVTNGNTYTVTVRAKSGSPAGWLWFGINTSGGTDAHEASGTIYPAENARSTNWVTFTWTGTATGNLITLFLDTYDGVGYWDTASPGPVTVSNSTFNSSTDGWNIATWHSGSFSDGTMAFEGGTGNPAGDMLCGASGATNNSDSCTREGGEINKAISTSGYPGLVQVQYDLRFNTDQTGGSCIGSCIPSVLEGDCADKLAVYYSTAGTGGPWTLLEVVNASGLTQNLWYTRTINCPSGANNQANFAVRFKFQFNTAPTDNGRLDNIKVIGTP